MRAATGLRSGSLLCLALVAGPALAGPATPFVDARLRYESVDQQGLPETGDALTLRVRAGLAARLDDFSALVETQGTLKLAGNQWDGLSAQNGRPLIADPQDIGLTRAEIGWKQGPLALTLGCQRIQLDDERFVGAVGFRQNGQSFDAVRVRLEPLKGLQLDASYVWRTRTIWGIDGEAARPRSIGGNTILLNLGWASPIGRLTGFGYWIGQDDAAISAHRQESRTLGLRLQGRQPAGPLKFGYQFGFARQQDHRRNPNDYAVDYWLADGALEWKVLRAGLGYEVLGASSGLPFTSFQTPLGTNFKFQGWADKFLTTPPDGVRDLYLSGGLAAPSLGRLKAPVLQAQWHSFESDRNRRAYGTEWNLLAGATVGRTTASLRFADYRARAFATDTTKFWLQLDWKI